MKDDLWILTYSGKKIHPLDPSPEEISIIDIAAGLSHLCRFTGHCRPFYSVADHSILVSSIVEPQFRLQALLHDASEFALNDLNSVLKHSGKFNDYKYYEHQLQSMIYKKFGLPPEEPKEVKTADQRLLETELRDLMKLSPDHQPKQPPLKEKIVPLSPEDSERLFLHTFRMLVSPNDYEKWISE